ncbi:MAG: Type IV secretory pathway VirB4 components-like protein [Parcubacteria group bacterium Gr01-1014_30]|nr:MAG: Type IV secretory pathway VirB4 components-like protein [Parcubacteria group bacterium Gr01-1014_30]
MRLPFFKKKTEIAPELFEEGRITLGDIVAPSAVEIGQNFFKLGERLGKTYFVFSYPRYLSAAWMYPVINMNSPMDISFYLHPLESEKVLKQLRKRVTEVQSEIMEREGKGLVRDPSLETAYRDLEALRDQLQTAQERMLRFGLYLTVYGDTQEEIKSVETDLRSVLESRLIYIKPALYQQKEGLTSSSPYNEDKLFITTAMNSGTLASTFPFVSFDLSANEGILYGINTHNASLVLFDRFSLENPNSVIFGTSGSGKSYAIKLEILRQLMMGVDVIVIDPENEYKSLVDAVGGEFFNVSLTSPHHLNPFDVPRPKEDERPDDVLRTNIINLVGFLRTMLGGLTPEEDGIIHGALVETYAAKDITGDTDPKTWPEKTPVMSDFEDILSSMEGTESLVKRLQKFTKGAYSQFFNQRSNVTMQNRLVVFGIRDMEEELRPAAMYIVLRFLWKQITSQLKRRILVVDEAWWMMKTEDGASFLFGTVKRSRKYWLGVTTVTQDVNDFMKSSYGQPIVTNSALKILMKQSPATIDILQKAFNLTDQEKNILLETAVGEAIFFAGLKHVAIKVVASYTEDQIITTNPEEVARMKKAKKELTQK